MQRPIATPLYNVQSRILYDTNIVKQVRIDDYYEQVVSKNVILGQGINGKVIKLRCKRTGRICAMKQIQSDSKGAREVTLHYVSQAVTELCQITSPSILKIYDMSKFFNIFLFFLKIEIKKLKIRLVS